MKKFDMEVSLYKYLLHLKEEELKKYDKNEAQKDVIYVFNNYDDFRYYFVSYGVDVDEEILNLCKIKTTMRGKIVAFKGLCDHYITAFRNKQKADKAYEEFGLGFAEYDLEKTSERLNNFEIRDNLINFYPPNDGRSTKPIYFNKGNLHVINNDAAFSEITNLDDILLKMVKMYDISLYTGEVYNPYGFMLELTDEIKPNYRGKANLVCTEVSNPDFDNKEKKEEAYAFFMNRFLDHFMGWNFGVSIRRSEELRNALESLNDKVIRRGIREYAGTGLDVLGSDDFSINGLQHYYLPFELENKKNK